MCWSLGIFALVFAPVWATLQISTSTTVRTANKTHKIILTCYKPVTKSRHVCGTVMEKDRPVSDVKVSIARESNGSEVESQRTGRAGEFNFKELDAGIYWLDVEDAAATSVVRHKINLVEPEETCSRRLQVPIIDCEPVRKGRSAPTPIK